MPSLSSSLYASVSGSLTGKSILSPAQHKSICVTVPFLWKHFYALHSCDCASAFKHHTEVYGIVGSVEEILDRVSNNKIKRIVNAAALWIPESGWINIPLEKLKVSRVNYPNNCFTLPFNIIPDIKVKHVQELRVWMKNFDSQ